MCLQHPKFCAAILDQLVERIRTQCPGADHKEGQAWALPLRVSNIKGLKDPVSVLNSYVKLLIS